MATHSFICKGCVHFGVNEQRCAECNGQGYKFDPINEKLYEEDPYEYSRRMILGISVKGESNE